MRTHALIGLAVMMMLLIVLPHPAEAGTRTKTVEFFINTSKLSIAANGWFNTTFYIQLPEDSIYVRSAWIEVFGISPAGAAGSVNAYLDNRLLAAQTLSGGSETVAFSYLANGTIPAYPTSGLYGITDSTKRAYTLSLRALTSAYNVLSAKAVITYDYDDASATQLQTVELFVNQSQRVPNYAAGAWYNSTFNMALYGESPSVKSAWFEVSGLVQHTVTTSVANLTFALNGGNADRSPYNLATGSSTDETTLHTVNINATSAAASVYSITSNALTTYTVGTRISYELSNNVNIKLYVTYTTTKVNQTTLQFYLNSTAIRLPGKNPSAAAGGQINYTFPLQLFGTNPKVTNAFFEIYGVSNGSNMAMRAWTNLTLIMQYNNFSMAFTEMDGFKTIANATPLYSITDNVKRYYNLSIHCHGVATTYCQAISAKLVVTYNFTNVTNQTTIQLYANSTQGSVASNTWVNQSQYVSLVEDTPAVHSAFYGMNMNKGATVDAYFNATLGRQVLNFVNTYIGGSGSSQPYFAFKAVYNASNSTTSQSGTPYSINDNSVYLFPVGMRCITTACFNMGAKLVLTYSSVITTTTPPASTTVTVTQVLSASATAPRASDIARTRTQTLTEAFSIKRAEDAIRSLAQSFSLDNVYGSALARMRTLSQTLNAPDAVGRMQSMLRGIPQLLSTDHIAARASEAIRSLTQAFSWSSQAGTLSAEIYNIIIEASVGVAEGMGRVASSVRSMAQSLLAQPVTARFGTAFRALSQSFSASSAAARIAEIPRILAQSFSAAGMSKTLSSFSRALAQAVSESIVTARIQSLYKTLSQSFAANVITSRVPVIAKTLTQAVSIDALSGRLSYVLRMLTQSTSTSLVAVGVRGVFRSITQTISAILQASTLDVYNRLVNAITSITGSAAKLRQVDTLSTQFMFVSSGMARVFEGVKEASQALGWSAMPQRVADSLRAVTQSMSPGTTMGTAFEMIRMAVQSLSPSAIAGRMTSLSRILAQAVAPDIIAARIASIARTLSQQFDFLAMTMHSFELTYNKVASLYVTATDAVSRGFDAVRAIPQSVASNVFASRLSSAVRTLVAQLQLPLISGRFSEVTKSIAQSLAFAQYMETAFGMLREVPQSLSAESLSGRLASLARAVPQRLDPAAIAARAASMFRTLSQSFSYASQIYTLVFKSYDTVATAALQITGNAVRLVSAIRATVQSMVAGIGASRLFDGAMSVSNALGIGSAAARAGEAARAVTQSLYSASATLGAFVRSRIALLGFAFSDAATRLASVSRAAAQTLSVESAARIPSFLFQKIASLAMSIADALQKIRTVGRTATGAFTLTDATGRIAELARTIGNSLSASAVAARAAAFYRNAFTALSVLFGWFFRFPAWAYSSQPTCEAAGYYWCSGACTTLSCDTQHNVTYADVTADLQMQVNETGTNVSIAVLSNTTLNNVAFETWSYEDTPAATTLAADTDTQSLTYFNVTANSTLNATTLQWLMITFNYTDSEVSEAGLSESSISVYMYNETLGLWVQLTNSSADVFATGLHAGDNYGWVNKTNMSLYALGGLYVNGHACSVSAECYSGACCSGTCQTSCAAAPTPTPSPGGGGGSIITPPAESYVKYKKIAVLREVVPGQAVVVGVEVKNEGAIAQKGMQLSVSGVPAGWISKSVSSIDVPSSESEGFNVVVSPAADAVPGDYKVTLKLKNAAAESENFFIVRVRNVPADYGRPLVTRSVDIDRDAGRTDVDIVVSNAYAASEFERIDVVESIPKELANSTDYVDFDTKPSEIVRPDPIVMWSMTGMAAGETRTLSYSVHKVLDEFTPYIYWPIRQLDVIAATAPSTMRLTGFVMPYFNPGVASAITFKVKNIDSSPHNFTFGLEMPAGWKMAPEDVKETLAPGEEKEFRVTVTPAVDAKVGRNIVRAAFGWDGTYVVKEYVAETATAGLSLLLIAAVAAVFAIGAWYGYQIRPQARMRAMSQARRMMSMADKLGRIRDTVAPRPRPPEPGRAAFESELAAVWRLRTSVMPPAKHADARPIRSSTAGLEYVRNTLRRRNRPWKNYWG